MICRGCGGVLGRDCWNEPECMWITEDMQRRAQEAPLREAEEAYWREQEDRHYDDLLADAIADGDSPVVIGHA